MRADFPVREAQVATLRSKVSRLEGARPPEDDRPLSTGSAALDRLLPAGGLRRGTLVEYLSSGGGCGAGALALTAAREACAGGRALVVADTVRMSSRKNPPIFYPPAAAAWGLDLSRLLILRPTSEADALWALDQALRCPGVGAVWAVCDWLDIRDFRRLQLAAETGGTLGLLLRPDRFRGQPTWADAQWHIRSLPLPVGEGRGGGLHHSCGHWQLHVELLRCRGSAGGASVCVELDETAGIWREATNHASHPLPVAAELADSTPARLLV